MESGVEDVTVPVYLGDSLQLRTETGSLLAGQNVTIEVEGDPLFGGSTRRLEFPRALVEQADWFDGVMYRIGECIEAGDDPLMALDDAGIPPGAERNTLENTITRLVESHAGVAVVAASRRVGCTDEPRHRRGPVGSRSVGLGAGRSQHILPRAGLCGVCQEGLARCGPPAGRSGRCLARSGGRPVRPHHVTAR